MQQEHEEIEVNFRLDAAGRTVPTDPQNSGTDDENAKHGTQPTPVRQYEPHSIMTEFYICQKGDDPADKTQEPPASISNKNNTVAVDWTDDLLDELLYDCEISDCGLMPRTFWVPCQGFEPRCSLEQIALDVFHHHTAASSSSSIGPICDSYDPTTSGAEWWVQIRPSPEKTGRYSMFAGNENSSNDNDGGEDKDDMAKEGISFHWDKDEDLRMLCGGNTYVHPHLSTVTYLTDIVAAPTLALNIRVHSLTGEWIMPVVNGQGNNNTTEPTNNEKRKHHDDDDDNNNKTGVEGFLSWPKFGKHLSFDGRYLHAAPSDLMEPGTFQKQCEIPNKQQPLDNEKLVVDRKKLQRRKRRVTFLVNLWLNYKPFGVEPFPETMITKLSGHLPDQPRLGIRFHKDKEGDDNDNTKDVEISSASHCHIQNSMIRFHWPMGDCNSGEIIEADIPIDHVRAPAKKGGSLRLKWHHANGVQMIRAAAIESTESKTSAQENPNTSPDENRENETKRPRLEAS